MSCNLCDALQVACFVCHNDMLDSLKDFHVEQVSPWPYASFASEAAYSDDNDWAFFCQIYVVLSMAEKPVCSSSIGSNKKFLPHIFTLNNSCSEISMTKQYLSTKITLIPLLEADQNLISYG